MIVGVGLDVVELERIEKILKQPSGKRFAEKVLTAKEGERWASLPFRRSLEFIAGRFAAKEAVVKAFGCGIGLLAGFHDIEILPDSAGKPECLLSEACWNRLGHEAGRHKIHVAITHERKLAAATAVVERIV
jgi:holo-[acyl-carrier protein] synthase